MIIPEYYKNYLKEGRGPEILNSDPSTKTHKPSDNYLSTETIKLWDNIPNELKKLKQWVTWKVVLRDGKETKIPYQPNGKKASVTNSKTWSAFEDVQESNRIGFVFTDNDPYVFIDIDGNKDTGSISPSAKFWIKQINSYTEYSPSRIGFHIIIKGNKKIRPCRRGDFEIYEQDRFATFTGDIYKDLNSIEERQEQLERLQRIIWPDEYKSQANRLNDEQESYELIDERMILKIADKDKTLYRLWTGDTSGYRSNSEADLALCEKLAYYTGGDSTQIEHLFKSSGLARDKWVNRKDYRNKTIEKAKTGINAYYDHSTINSGVQSVNDDLKRKYKYPKPIPLNKIMQAEFKPRKDVISGLIPSGLTLLMSAEKNGKSSKLRQVGFSVATGTRCFGGSFSPAVSGSVLYLSFEDDSQSIQECMELYCQDSAPPNYQFQYEWPTIGNGCIRALQAYINDFPTTKLIIIDTLAYIRQVRKGAKQNGGYSEDVEELHKLKQLANENNLSIIVSTHTKKGKEDDWTRNVHGGVGQTATADTIIFIDRKRGSSKAFFHITGKRIKDKSLSAYFEHRSWTIQEDDKLFNLTPVMQEYWDIFVENDNRQMTPKEFVKKLYPDLNDNERTNKYDSVRQQLSRMSKAKKLLKVERSYYKMYSDDYESYKNMREH
jgi:hypothetical protein